MILDLWYINESAGSAHAGSAHAGSAHAGSAHAGSAHTGSAHAGSAPPPIAAFQKCDNVRKRYFKYYNWKSYGHLR